MSRPVWAAPTWSVSRSIDLEKDSPSLLTDTSHQLSSTRNEKRHVAHLDRINMKIVDVKLVAGSNTAGKPVLVEDLVLAVLGNELLDAFENPIAARP